MSWYEILLNTSDCVPLALEVDLSASLRLDKVGAALPIQWNLPTRCLLGIDLHLLSLSTFLSPHRGSFTITSICVGNLFLSFCSLMSGIWVTPTVNSGTMSTFHGFAAKPTPVSLCYSMLLMPGC